MVDASCWAGSVVCGTGLMVDKAGGTGGTTAGGVVCRMIVEVSMTSMFEVTICVTRTGAWVVASVGIVSKGADDTLRQRWKRTTR